MTPVEVVSLSVGATSTGSSSSLEGSKVTPEVAKRE